MVQADQGPIYLSGEGRTRLEGRLAAYETELQQRDADAGGAEAEDTVDQATDLEAGDDRIRLRGLISAARLVLDRAQPLPSQPDDGVVRQGATVRVRDEARGEEQYRLVDGAELDPAAAEAALDSPVGRALLGRARGDRITIRTPAGERVLTILSVEPYRVLAT